MLQRSIECTTPRHDQVPPLHPEQHAWRTQRHAGAGMRMLARGAAAGKAMPAGWSSARACTGRCAGHPLRFAEWGSAAPRAPTRPRAGTAPTPSCGPSAGASQSPRAGGASHTRMHDTGCLGVGAILAAPDDTPTAVACQQCYYDTSCRLPQEGSQSRSGHQISARGDVTIARCVSSGYG